MHFLNYASVILEIHFPKAFFYPSTATCGTKMVMYGLLVMILRWWKVKGTYKQQWRGKSGLGKEHGVLGRC